MWKNEGGGGKTICSGDTITEVVWRAETAAAAAAATAELGANVVDTVDNFGCRSFFDMQIFLL